MNEEITLFPEPVSSTPTLTSRWRRYCNFLRTKWWLPVVTASTALTAMAIYLDLKPIMYFSEASMFVSGKLRLQEMNLYAEDLDLVTEIQVLQSSRIQERAYSRVQNFNPDTNAPPVRVKITQVPRSKVIELRVIGSYPSYTRAYLQAIIDEYLTYKKDTRALSSEDTVSKLKNELEEQQRVLEKKEKELRQFQQTNDIAVLEKQGISESTILAKLNVELAELSAQDRLLASIKPEQILEGREYLSGGTAGVDQKAVVDNFLSTIPQAEYSAAKRQIDILKGQRDEFGRAMRPQHPKIKWYDDQIRASEKYLEGFRGQTMGELVDRQKAIQSRMDNIKPAIKEAEEKIRKANEQLYDLDQYKRNVQRAQSLYEGLQNLLQSVDVNKNLDQERVSILTAPSMSLPANTRALLKLGIALLGGLGLGFGLIYCLERMDDRFTSLTELTEQFQEEIVGQIPRISIGNSKLQSETLKLGDEEHMFVESFRNIRSSLLFMPTAGNRPKTILVTSSVPNEGKSIVTANLARTMASGGSRVLLIDGDLRKGHLHKLFGLPRTPGLTDFLLQEASYEQVVVSTSLPNLFFIPSGKVSNDSGDLYLSPSTDLLLNQISLDFDCVLFDSAPLFAADDTASLAPKMDGVILVVRNSFTRARLAREALNSLYQRRVKVIGLIFNQVNSAESDYCYYKYRRYYNPKLTAAV